MLKELIIQVDNRNIYLSPKSIIPIQYTNIPIEYCTFRSHGVIFWKVELISYNPDTKCWRMKVVDYFPDDIKNFDRQKSKNEVEQIAFETFDWKLLEQHLSSYQKIKLREVLHNYEANRFFYEKIEPSKSSGLSGVSPANRNREVSTFNQRDIEPSNYPITKGHVVCTLPYEFSIYFSDARFMLGYVSFQKTIKEVDYKVDFKIKNEYLLPEFEYIKSWFAKKLKTKKFKVKASITITDGKISKTLATSPQIDMINAELIDSIKYQRTLSLTKPGVTEIDKTLFTSEDIFDEIKTDDIEGNVFQQDEQDIINCLLENHKTRNKRHLQYLSGKKQSGDNKIRFTLHPNFGFLFLIKGEENNHFVWELLNSHATYIWTISKMEQEIELQYKRIEASINTIRDNGREQYKRAYRYNHQDHDLVFSVIEHEDINSNFIDGFVKWKHKLNERIT